MKKAILIVFKSLAALILTFIAVVAVFSVSPIYDFSPARPFSGPDIFNPYAALDTTISWKRANFHTHTKVKGPLNECEAWPDETLADLKKFGYDIVTFSNHNALTIHPEDTSLQVNVYEHGYNFFKYHKLVFGADRVCRFDHLLPLLASQKQWQLDLLGKYADFIQMNHPFRTNNTSKDCMEKLTGYQIMELDSGVTLDQDYWDWALSAGHYSFGLANDDLHHSKRIDCIAVRCNWLNTPSERYEDLKNTLLSGAYYSMRVPSCSEEGWDYKYELNSKLPSVRNVELKDSLISISLSEKASLIRANGQDHTVLAELENADKVDFCFHQDEPYVRFTAFFENGAVIYINPFAHYDSRVSSTPYEEAEHSVNWPQTIAFNLMLAALVVLCAFAVRCVFVSGRKCSSKGRRQGC